MTNITPFIEIAVILGLSTIIGIIGQKLRQPLIIMFLAAGIIAGPSFLGIIHSHEKIELLADIGIALLLFIVGLKLEIKLIRSTGPVALATGMGQILFTSAIGFVISLLFGMNYLTAAYVSVALTFSSTIIIVKLLSDKKEIDSLHGQIAIGFLIVQDIAAILALIGLTTFGAPSAGEGPMYLKAAIIFAKGLGFLALIAVLMKYVLPRVITKLAHSLELLTLFAISWAVFLGAGSELLGFSKEVGAFLAGVSLASTDFRDTIGSRMTSLRDFLILFFFIDLGARLDWSTVSSQIGTSIVFSIFVLIGNPLIVLIIMGRMGYRRRTSFLAGLTVAQISEFSLIVAALGLSIGHITKETVGLITLVGVITIFLSTYMILYSGQLYNYFSNVLKIFERKNAYREAAIDTLPETASIDIILVGIGNFGTGIAEYLTRRNKTILGVDFDPSVLERCCMQNMSIAYGDMADPDFLEHLPLNKSEWIISTVRSTTINLAMLNNLKNIDYKGRIAVTAASEDEASEYRNAGADLVFCPFSDAAEQAADALAYSMDLLPSEINWPVSFLDIRIKSDGALVGQAVKDIPIRSLTGVSILSVSRGGQVHYDIDPNFVIYPGDRLLIMGPPEGLKEAERVLSKLEFREYKSVKDRFEIAEIRIGDNSSISGKTIAEIGFRQKYDVTLIGVQRDKRRITEIDPSETLLSGDILIIIGKSESVKKLKTREPL